MILIICQQCKHGLRVSPGDMSGEMSEAQSLFGPGSEYHPDKYPCFHCGEKAEIVSAAESAALHLVKLYEVTPQEAFAAVHGLGLPEEQECSPSALKLLFSSQKVVGLLANQIRNSHRSILKEIHFEDGTKMFLASSAYGATVYRISKPHSYVRALEDG